jgi:transposase-like protein
MDAFAIGGINFKKEVLCPECKSPNVVQNKRKKITGGGYNFNVPLRCEECKARFTVGGYQRSYGN